MLGSYLQIAYVIVIYACIASCSFGGEEKIAFLFLTRGHIPFEPIWREFFRFRVRPEEYSIYVHPQKGFHFRNTSFFHGKEINRTVETVYLKSSVQEAERELLKAALEDKNNAYFCLVSESCIPLHPFRAMMHALQAAGRSLVNACRQVIIPHALTAALHQLHASTNSPGSRARTTMA